MSYCDTNTVTEKYQRLNKGTKMTYRKYLSIALKLNLSCISVQQHCGGGQNPNTGQEAFKAGEQRVT